MKISERNMMAACRVVMPELAAHPRSDRAPDQEEFQSFQRAARTRLRDAIAALSGIDPETNIPAANKTDFGTYMLVRGNLITDLKSALLNGPVIAAMQAQIGPERVASLLSELDLIG